MCGNITVTIARVAMCGKEGSWRFRSNEGQYLLTVMRCVERNPVHANSIPMRKAQRWPCSSVGTRPKETVRPKFYPWPVFRRQTWLAWVNQPLGEGKLQAVRESVDRGHPFGNEACQKGFAKKLGSAFTMRHRGRPRKAMNR
jgi:putative transposase